MALEHLEALLQAPLVALHGEQLRRDAMGGAVALFVSELDVGSGSKVCIIGERASEGGCRSRSCRRVERKKNKLPFSCGA